jgi:hypothetical protein
MKHAKKKIIRLDGQLGNQLFQLAFALNVGQKNQVSILLDDYLPSRKKFKRFLFKELCVFNYFQYCSKLCMLTNRIQHNYTLRKFYQPDHLFIESENDDLELVYRSILSMLYKSYTGFFQSPKLFPDKEILVKAFSLRPEFICSPLERFIRLAKETQCLAISVRRGDFLQSSHLGVCSEEYYFNGINHIRSERDIDCIFVFSDDIKYCRNLFSFLDGQVIYVEGFTPAKSLHLMNQCKHFVIANSTFSWWGAWLSESQDKLVVSPDPWNDCQPVLSDFIPPDWINLPKHPSLYV